MASARLLRKKKGPSLSNGWRAFPRLRAPGEAHGALHRRLAVPSSVSAPRFDKLALPRGGLLPYRPLKVARGDWRQKMKEGWLAPSTLVGVGAIPH